MARQLAPHYLLSVLATAWENMIKMSVFVITQGVNEISN
jgi:hypothetical protein